MKLQRCHHTLESESTSGIGEKDGQTISGYYQELAALAMILARFPRNEEINGYDVDAHESIAYAKHLEG
jgi:hypothetical protein